MNQNAPITLHQAIQFAVEHHRAGRLAAAKSIYDQVLVADPTHFDALHLGGVAAHQMGHHTDAVALIDRAIRQNDAVAAAHHHLGEAHRALNALGKAEICYQRAIAIDPGHAEAHNSLGIVLQSQHRAEQAVASFERAIAAKPQWGAAHFNLGLARKDQGDTPGAIRTFFEGWSADGTSAESAGQCVATLADAVRDGLTPDAAVPVTAPARLSFTIAFCSIDDAKRRRTIALYERLFADVDHEIIAIRDARSLAEAYNRAADRSRSDVVILSHDDIDILAPDFAARLAGCFGEMDVVGVIGGREVAGPRWSSAGHPHLGGWIVHHDGLSAPYQVDLVSPWPRITGVKVLDGVFIAARREVLSQVRFDEETFDGFHLYDIDWSCRAAAAGFVVGTAGDLLLVHESRGRFRGEWQRYADRFCSKYGIDYVPPAEAVKIWEASLETEDEARRFFSHLMMLDRLGEAAPGSKP